MDAEYVHLSNSGVQFGRVFNGVFQYFNKGTNPEWEDTTYSEVDHYHINLTDQTGRGYPTLEWFLKCGHKLELELGDICYYSRDWLNKVLAGDDSLMSDKPSHIYVSSLHDNRHDLTAMARDEYYKNKAKERAETAVRGLIDGGVNIHTNNLHNENLGRKKSETTENQWPDSDRIDAIEQNRNNGEHYPHESESPLSPNFEGKPRINASTALYAFAGWLTSLKEPVTFSENHLATPAADMVAAFVSANGLGGEVVVFDRVTTPSESAVSKPPSSKESKPVYTQEMANAGELPPVGSEADYESTFFTHASSNKGACKVIAYFSDKVWIDITGGADAVININVINFKPIDTRTDEEKLRDAWIGTLSPLLIQSLSGAAFDLLIQSKKFTITLNEEG